MSIFVLHHQQPGIEFLLHELERQGVPSGTEIPEVMSKYALVRWGDGKEQLHFAHIQDGMGAKNDAYPYRPVELAAGTMERRLRTHGVLYLQESDRSRAGVYFIRQYAVPVFHLEALAIFENEFVEIEQARQNKTHLKLMREAVKAVYLLGWDAAVVRLVQDGQNRPLIVDIDPQPRLNRRLGSLFARAIGRFAEAFRQQLSHAKEVRLGADPEFILRAPDGKIVSADRYLPMSGPVGCDAVVLRDRRVIFPLAELRPEPSSEPRELVRHLYRTMRTAAGRISDPAIAWLSGGMPRRGFALGGHIHFSGVWLNSFLLRTLDNYLALPLMLLEDEHTRMRRPRFGFLGDFRCKAHGGFEYRTPPSWLASPRIAAGVLSLARFIADNFWRLEKRPLRQLDAQVAFYAGDKLALADKVREVWEEIRKLPDYARHARDLEPLAEMTLRMESWDEERDFRPAWKIPPFLEQTKTKRQIMI